MDEMLAPITQGLQITRGCYFRDNLGLQPVCASRRSAWSSAFLRGFDLALCIGWRRQGVPTGSGSACSRKRLRPGRTHCGRFTRIRFTRIKERHSRCGSSSTGPYQPPDSIWYVFARGGDCSLTRLGAPLKALTLIKDMPIGQSNAAFSYADSHVTAGDVRFILRQSA